jgi:hypothetical protein
VLVVLKISSGMQCAAHVLLFSSVPASCPHPGCPLYSLSERVAVARCIVSSEEKTSTSVGVGISVFARGHFGSLRCTVDVVAAFALWAFGNLRRLLQKAYRACGLCAPSTLFMGAGSRILEIVLCCASSLLALGMLSEAANSLSTH